MPFWSATIAIQPAYGNSDVHVFIIDADHYVDARDQSLTRANFPESRRHRRNAVLIPH
jgi:hypothetical protein